AGRFIGSAARTGDDHPGRTGFCRYDRRNRVPRPILRGGIPLPPTMEWSMATSRTEGKRTTRPKRPRYQALLELPPLPPEQYEALKGSIAVNGVLVPILVDGEGTVRGIIDGNNRKRIADEVGYDCPETIKDGLTEEEKRLLARCLNLARRHLTQEQRR